MKMHLSTDIINGKITVKPGIANIPDRFMSEGGASDFVITTQDDSTVAVVDGQIAVVGNSYSEITWRWEHPDYSTDEADESLQDVVDSVSAALGRDATFEGSFTIWQRRNTESDIPFDIRRLRVDRGKAILEAGTVTWPDGTHEEW